MESNGGSGVRGWVLAICRILGLCIFAAAFFLPAVKGGAPDSDGPVFAGWKCASIALSETNAVIGKSVHWPPPLEAVLVAMSGWINPLLALILLLSFWRKLRIVRMVFGAVILLCMAATWTFFVLEKVTPLIGHVLWIAGALLVLAADAVPRGASPARSESAA